MLSDFEGAKVPGALIKVNDTGEATIVIRNTSHSSYLRGSVGRSNLSVFSGGMLYALKWNQRM